MGQIDFERILASMERNLERCAFPELEFQISFYCEHVKVGADADVLRRFNQIRAKAQKGLDFERQHGRWTLLKHHHPTTIMLKELGLYKTLFQVPA